MARAKQGDRVRMTGIMFDDPAPMEVGAEGTVTYVNEDPYGGLTQICVDWDNGRSLMLLSHDPFMVLPRKETTVDELMELLHPDPWAVAEARDNARHAEETP